MIVIQEVDTAGDLKKLLKQVPDDMPVRYADNPLAQTLQIEVGELRDYGISTFIIFPIGQ